MANKRILDLPEATSSTVGDVVAIDGTTTRKITVENLLDDNLVAIKGLSSAADKGIQFTGVGTAATYDLTSAGKALLDDADAAAQRATLGLTPGTDVQAYDADLAALAANSTNGIWARTGSGTGAARTITGTSGQISITNGDGVSGNPTAALVNTAVTPGSYTSANITVDAQGRLTAAANGAGGGLSAGGVTAQYLGTSAVPFRAGLLNGIITESHTGGAVTFALKTLAGTNPSSSDPVSVLFASSSGYVIRSVTAALSVTVSSGSTLGFINSTAFELNILAIDNVGTVELAVGNQALPSLGAPGTISTTAEGGAGAADSPWVWYSTTARSNVAYSPIAIARYSSGLAAVGTWGVSPSTITLYCDFFNSVPYEWSYRADVPQFAVGLYRSKFQGRNTALDMVPKGTPSASSEGLYVWLDLGDIDIGASYGSPSHWARVAMESGGNLRLQAIGYDGAGNGDITFYTGNTNRMTIFALNGSVNPGADNTSALGFTTARYTAVYAVNGTIQTSDPSKKTEIQSLPDALPIISKINPITFKWIEGGQEYVDDLDADGNPQWDYIENDESRSKGKVKRQKLISKPGKRTHWGFNALNVRDVMAETGRDFGGYVLGEDGSHHMRPDQLIPVLWKAVQELSYEIKKLKGKNGG